MKTIHLIMILILSYTLTGCAQEPEPIAYGEDHCHFCSMRIMDPRFGSEAVTDKGRVYKFDSSECLLRYLNKTEQAHAHLLVTNYQQPQTFLEAVKAAYVISEHMPSPMGGDLNAFDSESSATRALDSREGQIVNWEELVAIYKR